MRAPALCLGALRAQPTLRPRVPNLQCGSYSDGGESYDDVDADAHDVVIRMAMLMRTT